MVSAFHPPVFHTPLDDEDSPSIPLAKKSTIRQVGSQLTFDADETEDEEVKMNCIGGIPPDSDYCTSSDEDNEDDNEDDLSIKSNKTESDRYVTLATSTVIHLIDILLCSWYSGLT